MSDEPKMTIIFPREALENVLKDYLAREYNVRRYMGVDFTWDLSNPDELLAVKVGARKAFELSPFDEPEDT